MHATAYWGGPVAVIISMFLCAWLYCDIYGHRIVRRAHELFERINLWGPEAVDLPAGLAADYWELNDLLNNHSELWRHNLNHAVLDAAMTRALTLLRQKCVDKITSQVHCYPTAVRVLSTLNDWSNLGVGSSPEELRAWLLKGLKNQLYNQRNSLDLLDLPREYHLPVNPGTPEAEDLCQEIDRLIRDLQIWSKNLFPAKESSSGPLPTEELGLNQNADLPQVMPDGQNDPVKVATGEDDGIWPSKVEH